MKLVESSVRSNGTAIATSDGGVRRVLRRRERRQRAGSGVAYSEYIMN